MHIFLDSKTKKEIEYTIKNDVLKKQSKFFNIIYKVKKYSGWFFFLSFSLFALSYFFLDKKYQAFPLLFSLFCLFIYLYITIFFRDSFSSFFTKVVKNTEEFIKQDIKNNQYSNSIAELLSNYIVKVKSNGYILISPSYFKNKEFLRSSFYDLLNNEKNINYQDPFGNSLLHYIVKIEELHGFIGMALLLGADPNIKNNDNISTREAIGQIYPEYITFMDEYNKLSHNLTNTIENKVNKKRL